MLTNNPNDTVPAWKLPLLEKRRQQADLERQLVVDEEVRLAQMPAWKREVYLRKRMQKKDEQTDGNVASADLVRKPAVRTSQERGRGESNGGNVGRNRDSSGWEREGISDDELSDSERLLPIQRNPILQSDLQRRPMKKKTFDTSPRNSKDFSVSNGNITSAPPHSDSYRSKSGNKRGGDGKDRGLGEPEEVTYGRGFVNKLLGRFRELSEKNHTVSLGNKRACSSENLLDDAAYEDFGAKSSSNLGNLKFSKGKAQSMENLTSSASEKLEFSSHQGRPLSAVNGFSTTTLPNTFRVGAEPTSNMMHNRIHASRETVGKNSTGNQLQIPAPSTVVVHESSPLPEDELPRNNIVLLTRTVFESITTSPPIELPNSKKKPFTTHSSKTEETRSEKTRAEKRCHDVPDSLTFNMSNGLNAYVADNAGASVEYRSDGAASDRSQDGKVRNNSDDKQGSSNMPNRVNLSESIADASSENEAIISQSSTLSKSEKAAGSGRNGLIVGKNPSKSSQVFQPHNDNGAPVSTKPETSRPLLALDVKDLPAAVQTPISKNDRQTARSEKHSTLNKTNFRDEDPIRKKGPGSLLVRPASNLLPSSTKVEYLNLTRYNDVKTGDFAPPKKRPSYYDDDDDGGFSDSIPVTNLDDVMDDARFSPKEGDPSIYTDCIQRFEFEGAGVRLRRSLLEKSKNGIQLKTRFDDSTEQTFEYPSEQSLINDWIEENPADDPEEDDHMIEPSSSLRHSPGISSTGSLAAYKSRLQVDYEIGLERPNDVDSTLAPSSLPVNDVIDDEFPVTAVDESSVWSSSVSSDLLF